jgi:hypothetical protein
MLHQCPCGGIVRCNGWFDGKGTDHCDSSARAIPRSSNFATDLSTTDSPTFSHRQARARIAANGAPRSDRSPDAVANTFPPANIRGTFPKPATVRRTLCRSAARAPHERFVDVTPISLRRLRPLQRLVRRQSKRVSQLLRENPCEISRRPRRLGDFSRADFQGSPVASPHRRDDVRWSRPVLRSPLQSRAPMTNLRRTFHYHRLTVERFAVKRWAAVRGRPSASTACWTALQSRIRTTSNRDCRSCVPCARRDRPFVLPS